MVRYANSTGCIYVIKFEVRRNSQMKWYPYGHDFGNAKIGGVTVLRDGSTCSCSIPTAFAKADITAMRNLGVKVDQSNTHVVQFHEEAMAYATAPLPLPHSLDAYYV